MNTYISDTNYKPVDGWVEGINRPLVSNRYVYMGNEKDTSVYLLGGDRPVIRLAERRVLLGTLRLSCKEKALEDCTQIRMRYRSGVIQWILSDPAFTGEIIVTATSPGEGLGLMVNIEAEEPVDFRYGGLQIILGRPNENWNENWNLNIRTIENDRRLLKTIFDEAWLDGNQAVWAEDQKSVILTGIHTQRRVHVKSDLEFTIDGSEVVGRIKKYFSACFEKDLDMEKAYREGLERSRRLVERFKVDTPDGYINAVCAVAAGEVDAVWHPPKTGHGTMSWTTPLLGWLIHYPHAMLGHHDRSKMLLKAYAAAQVTTDEKNSYEMDETYTIYTENSRFYGKGYIAEDQKFYNMQTQFFHQMISAWRYSADPEFKEILREALRLHLEREDACFDPEGTGLYASVINTWPTDSVSYGDAGAVEETAYVFAAYRAMAELTEGEESASYAAKAEKIKQAFLDELWIPKKGYPGVYKDRGGRLHEESWMYASFLPVECGLLDPFQAYQCAYYPLWALERAENGGFWFSNWTPGIWSVRECNGGENQQQASAFFKSGMEKEALDLVTRISRDFLNTEVPGSIMFPVIETATLYVKNIVEGLFGYYPDYPNNRVVVAPVLPFVWGRGSMEIPDVSVHWECNRISVKLKKAANLIVRMRLYAKELYEVIGAKSWHLEPGIGGMIVVIEQGFCDSAEIILRTGEECDFDAYEEMYSVPVGEDIFNPQGIDETSYGEHMAFRKMPGGYYREIRVHLGEDPRKVMLRQKQKTKLPKEPEFTKVDIRSAMNADVTQIFRQKYLSPRPEKGCYAQIGLDGFSYWTFPKWEITAPKMTLEKIGEAVSADGIPFAIVDSANNIAFASLWDNFPNEVEAEVGEAAKMAAVLIAGSTSPMQCGIENARLTFQYGDGTMEEVPLVNPDNYISLCPYPVRASNISVALKRNDVFNEADISLMKHFTPEIVELGENVRGLSVRWPLAEGKVLKSVRLKACSNEIIVGLLGITLIK